VAQNQQTNSEREGNPGPALGGEKAKARQPEPSPRVPNMPACISPAMRAARADEKAIRQRIKRAQRKAQRLARRARRQEVEERGRLRGTPGVNGCSAPSVRVGDINSEQTGSGNATAASDSEHTDKVPAQVEPAARHADGRVGPQEAPQAAGLGPRGLRGWTPGQRTQTRRVVSRVTQGAAGGGGEGRRVLRLGQQLLKPVPEGVDLTGSGWSP
jgi:hypothetical protein